MKVDGLLKDRDDIHASFTTIRTDTVPISSTSGSTKIPIDDSNTESPEDNGSLDGKEKSSQSKWSFKWR